MKKHYFKEIMTMLILLSVTMPVRTAAQTSTTYHGVEYNALAAKEIVKEYNYPVTISCSRYRDTYFSQFTYNDFNQLRIHAAVRGCEVRDFAIDGDTVFFCGRGWNDKGIIGFFNIQDLSFNGGVYSYSGDLYVYGNRPITTLEKLVTYRDTTGSRHIVCVGKVKNDDNIFPCIVDLFSESTGMFLGYNSGVVNDENLAQSMMDIQRFCTANYPREDEATRPVLPRDYLIVAGRDTNRHLCLRFFKAQSPLGASSLPNTLYTFGGHVSDAPIDYIHESHISPMTDSTIGVASVIKVDATIVERSLPFSYHELSEVTIQGERIAFQSIRPVIYNSTFGSTCNE